MDKLTLLTWCTAISSAGFLYVLVKLYIYRVVLNDIWLLLHKLRQDHDNLNMGTTLLINLSNERVTALEQAVYDDEEEFSDGENTFSLDDTINDSISTLLGINSKQDKES